MADYQFKAKSLQGKGVQGTVKADSVQEARVKIRAQQLIPLQIVPRQGGPTMAPQMGKRQDFGKVSPKELIIFTRQFAVLIGSGVPIIQSLESMSQGAKTPAMINTLNAVTAQVGKGKRLAEALEAHPRTFDKMYVNLIKAGEEGGVLDEVLNKLAEHMEKAGKLKSKIIGALTYPIVVLFVAFLVIAAMLIWVIPSTVEMFTSAGKELPALTQMVLDLSDFFIAYWYIIIPSPVVAGFLLKIYYETEDGRKTLDPVFIATPVFGTLIQKSSIARFSRTLSTLLSSGVQVNDSLDIAAATAGNYVIETALMKSKESINKGRTLSEPLEQEKYIPRMVSQMISIGEQSGNLDTMLTKIAEFFDDEVEAAAAALTSILEPVMMIVLGGIIAILVVAMYLPIFNLADVVTG